MSSIEEISEYTSINQTTSKSSLSGSKSLSFSSCHEDGLSEEEGEKKDHSDASSTKVIFYREFTDTSKVSLDDRRALSQRPAKRRSFCSKLEIKKRTKLLKSIEGSEESSDNFSKLQAKVRLRKIETVTYSRRLSSEKNSSRYKGRAYLRTRSPPLERPEPEDDSAKYSESIFRVFLKPEGVSVFQQKRQVQETKPPPKSSSLRKQRRDSDDCQSECSVLTECTVEQEQPLDVGYPAVPRKVTLSPERIKKASSKRSVHWEDEVTFIERSSSSISSSCGTWENECINFSRKKNAEKKIEKKKTNVLNDEKKSRRYKERVRKKMLKKLLQMEGHCGKNDCCHSDDSSCNTLESNASQISPDQIQPKKISCHRSKSIGSPIRLSSKDQISTFEEELTPITTEELKNKTKNRTKKPLNPESIKVELLRKSIRDKRNTPVRLRRRTSSPAVVDRHYCHHKTGDSSSTILLDCKPSEKNIDLTESNTIESASRLKFQCGENNFKKESDCRYEEVSTAAVFNRDLEGMSVAIVNDPSLATYEGCDMSEVISAAAKSHGKDSKNITAETLRECILALQRIKNLSPPSPKSRLEHLGLVQGIQCSLLGMQEKLLNDKLCKLNKLVNNFDIPSVEEPKTADGKKYTTYANKVRYEATKAIKDKGHNVYKTATVCKKEEIRPEKQISPKSSKILKSWENMQRAFSDRREKFLNELKSKRENTDSSNLAESDETIASSKNNSDSLNESKINESKMESKFVFFVHEEISETDKLIGKNDGIFLIDESKTGNDEESINVKLVEDVNFEKKTLPTGRELPYKSEQHPESECKTSNDYEREHSSSTEGVTHDGSSKEEIHSSSKPEVAEEQPLGPSNETKEVSPCEEVSVETRNSDTTYKLILINKRDLSFMNNSKKPEHKSHSVEKNQNSDISTSVSRNRDVAQNVTKDPGTISKKNSRVLLKKESAHLFLDANKKEKNEECPTENVKVRECPKEAMAPKDKECTGGPKKKIKSRESVAGARSVKSGESIGPPSRLSEKSGSSYTHSENSEIRAVSGPSSLESVDTKAARALARPPSRKPFFERNEQEAERHSDDPSPTNFRPLSRPTSASSAPGRPDNFMRASDDSSQKQPPPPRMYSTLKEKRSLLSASKRLEVNEKLESAIKSLNNKCASTTRSGTTIRSPSRGSSNDSIRKRISEIRQREFNPPEIKLDKKESGELAKISEKELESSKSVEKTLKAPQNPQTNQPIESDVSQKLSKKNSKAESVGSVKNHIEVPASRGQQNSPSKSSKFSEISNGAENRWGLQSAMDRRALIQERLRNYVPPWERLNLKPNTEIRNKYENKQSKDSNILERPFRYTGRSLSNPQSRSKNNFDLKMNGNVGGGSSPCSPVRSPLAQRQVRNRKSNQRFFR